MGIREEDIKNDDAVAVSKAIESSEDIKAKDKDGRSPLMLAVIMNSLEVAELLIVHGADVNEKRGDGTTLLEWASSEEMTALLKKHGTK